MTKIFRTAQASVFPSATLVSVSELGKVFALVDGFLSLAIGEFCALSAVLLRAVVKAGCGTVFDQFSFVFAVAITITITIAISISAVVDLGGAIGECFEVCEYSH